MEMKKFNSKILITSFVMLLCLFLFVKPVAFAEGPKPEKPFEVELIFGTQSPWTKKIPITIKITPNLDSKRTDVSWTIPTIIKVEPKYKNYFFAQKGKTYVVHANLDPIGVGLVNGSVNVVDWDYGYNYGTSEKFSFSLNEENEIVPYSNAYKTAKQTKAMVIIGGAIGLVVIIALILIRLAKKLIDYLQPPKDL